LIDVRRRTKIVATLGPAVASGEKVQALADAGMDVARINCSHGDWVQRRQQIAWVRESDQGSAPVAVLADLQGPKFRLGEIEGGVRSLEVGEIVTIGPEGSLPLKPGPEWDAMKAPAKVLIGDGDVQLRLLDKSGDSRRAKVIAGGEVKTRQGLTVAGASFQVPALTEKDLVDAEEAVRYGVDFIALSYLRHGEDMQKLRALVSKLDPTIRLVAKIETKEALKNLDSIVAASDAVMVARGDLGLQLEIEQVPLAQKKIIRACNIAGKPVITATQMLESMVKSARPTRAEASDVANAILDGSDAVMLSGETATGAYPVETVQMMSKIAKEAESALKPREKLAQRLDKSARLEPTEAVALAAVTLATSLKVKAILAMTASGLTASLLAKYRPRVPILAATWSHRTQAQMGVTWGITAVTMPPTSDTDEAVRFLIDAFVQRKWLSRGDRVVVTSGYPPGEPGKTNLVLVRDV